LKVKFLIAASLLCSMAFSANADNTEDMTAHEIVEETSEQVIQALKQDQDNILENPSIINKLVDEIVLPVCDLQQMGKYILGRHWKTANVEQRDAFITEFKKMLVRTYGQHMAEYSDAEVSFAPQKENSVEKKYQIVSTKLDLRNGTDPMQIDYVFHDTDNNQAAKMIDMRIEGVSILRTFKTAFNYEISETSLDELIERISISNLNALAMN